MIIGITGQIAAGKDSVVELVRSYYGYKHLSFAREVRTEARARGIEETRHNLQELGGELIRQFGGAYWSQRILAQINPGDNYAVDGFRNLGEIPFFRAHSEFFLFGVTAPEDLRHTRYNSREIDAGRLSSPLTLDKFRMMDRDDRNGAQSTDACYALIDYEIINVGTKENLRDKVIALMEELRKRRIVGAAKA